MAFQGVVIPTQQFPFGGVFFQVGDYHVHVEEIVSATYGFAHAPGDPTFAGILIVETVLLTEAFQQGVAGIVINEKQS